MSALEHRREMCAGCFALKPPTAHEEGWHFWRMSSGNHGAWLCKKCYEVSLERSRKSASYKKRVL